MDEWANDSSFKALGEIVFALKVVNDAAERTVKFGTDYSQIRTKNEDRRQNILQSVELGRRAFPKATKKGYIAVNAALSIPELLGEIDYDARPKT